MARTDFIFWFFYILLLFSILFFQFSKMALAILALIAIVPSVLSLQEVAPNLDTLFKWNFLEYNLPWDHVTVS